MFPITNKTVSDSSNSFNSISSKLGEKENLESNQAEKNNMALRATINRVRAMEGFGRNRYYSDGKGRVLSEEERAAEKIYIQKMERERSEKLKLKQAKEKAEQEKAGKKTEGGSQKA